jgi:hypothetical protein
MTMSDKKRDRNNGNEKTPAPSPNRRNTKTQRQETTAIEAETKDKEMNEIGQKDETVSNLSDKFNGASNDWKKRINAGVSSGWEITIPPPPSSDWDRLSATKKKDTEGFLSEDLKQTRWPLIIKDGWKDLKFLYQMDEKKTYWKELSDGLKRDTGNILQRKYAKAFKCILAFSSTEPKHLPGASIRTESIFLPDSVMTELWLASITVFGFTKKVIPVVFAKTDKIAPTTTAWKERDTAQAKGFTKDDLFKEGSDSAHDLCRATKNKLLKEGQDLVHWYTLFKKTNDKTDLTKEESKALYLAMKLAKTDPLLLVGWNDGYLQANEITTAWAGAYKLFGGAWKALVKFQGVEKPASAIKTPKYSAATVSTEANEAAIETDVETVEEEIPSTVKKNPYYVERKPPQPPKGKEKKKSWKHVTFLKARLSAYWDSNSMNYGQAMTLMLTEWVRMIDILIDKDPLCTVIVPWSDTDFGRAPLTKKSTKPVSKDGVAKKYADDFFLSKRQGGQFIRFRLGHNKPISWYLESPDVMKELEEQGISVYEDKIQDANVSIAGWAAGPVLGRNALEDIEQILQNHPIFEHNKIKYIELRVQQVRLSKGAWVKGEPRPVAVHFFVRARDAAKARKALNIIYPSKPKKDYPGGVQWRFVTNVMDPYFPKTTTSIKKAKNLRMKQQQFQKDMRSTPTMTIKNLYYRLTVEPYVTLAQVLMNWRSAKEPGKRLFLHVEQSWDQTELYYHHSMESEAEQVVPLLPLVLEQEYGPRAWNWFNDNAKDFLGGYEYNMETQQVTLKEEDINAAVDQEWEQSMGDDYNGEISDDEEGDNEYIIDIGHIILDATDRQRILDDESVGTMKSTAEALMQTPPGWEDDEDLPGKDARMKDVGGSTSTPSTLTSSNLSVENMTPQQLQALVKQASDKLNNIKLASTQEGGEAK